MKLDERLNNWAQAMRGGSGHGDSLVASIYFPNVRGRSVGTAVDTEDAQLVERAWRRLEPLERKILQMHFVWRASPGFICRRVGLKARPTSIFDLELAKAKCSIREKLHEAARQPVREFVSMQDIIDRLNGQSSTQATGTQVDQSVTCDSQPLAETR
jgi:hypothetical protein